MKHKASILRYLIVTMLAVLCAAVCFTGCKNETQRTVTWEVAEHATVKVEGYDALPEKVNDGTELVFTITCDAGYAVDTVKNGSRMVTAKNGKYTVGVSADTTISVTVKREVQAVKVSTKPTKLTYNAGESLDKTGMVVEVEYVGGVTETLKDGDYRVVYQGGAASGAFALGDTSFKVSYDGKESESVELTSAVLAKVTLDLDGGKLTEEYQDAIKANNELANAELKDGVFSFTFAKALTKAVALPTASEISKGENEGDYDFTGWTDGLTTIAVGDAASHSLKASFAPNYVRLTKIYYKMENGADGEYPCLILEGKFQLADQFFLFLYEGNDKVSVKNEETTKGKRGDDFVYTLDLRKLVNARSDDGKNFSGKWMDIRIVYGDAAEATDEAAILAASMEVDLTRYPKDFIDENSSLTWTISPEEEYVFTFATHTPDGTTARNLKTMFKVSLPYTFTVSGEVNEDGLPVLKIDGTAKKDRFEGQYVRIDIESVSEAQYAKIEDGKWTMTFVLGPKNLALNTAGYMHFNIVEKEGDSKGSGYQSNEANNLDNIACKNTNMTDNGDFAPSGNDYLISGLTLRIANEDDSAVYYIGAGKWGGFIIYGVNEKESISFVNDQQISLKVDNMETPTKVYYVFYVKVGGTHPYSKEDIQSKFVFGNIDPNTGETYLYDCAKIEDMGDGIYRVWYDITAYTGGQLWPNFYAKDEVEEGADQTYSKAFEIRNASEDTASLYVIVDGGKWSIKVDYSGPCVVYGTATTGESNPASADPEKFEELTKPEPKPEPTEMSYTPTAVELEQGTGTVVYYVIKGTYTGGTATEAKTFFEALYFDFQFTGGDWKTFKELPRVVTTDDTNFTIKVDVSSLTAYKYTAHLDSTDGQEKGRKNFTLSDTSINGKSLTVNGWTYQLVNVPGSNDNADDCFGTVGLWVKPEHPAPELTIDAVELQAAENKVYYIITLTFTNTVNADDLTKFSLRDGSVKYDVEKNENVSGNKYKLYFNVTDYSGEQLWPHLYFEVAGWDGSSGDVKVTASGSVDLNGKTYKLEDGYGMPTLKVSTAE